jgi:hypothetical protein
VAQNATLVLCLLDVFYYELMVDQVKKVRRCGQLYDKAIARSRIENKERKPMHSILSASTGTFPADMLHDGPKVPHESGDIFTLEGAGRLSLVSRAGSASPLA